MRVFILFIIILFGFSCNTRVKRIKNSPAAIFLELDLDPAKIDRIVIDTIYPEIKFIDRGKVTLPLHGDTILVDSRKYINILVGDREYYCLYESDLYHNIDSDTAITIMPYFITEESENLLLDTIPREYFMGAQQIYEDQLNRFGKPKIEYRPVAEDWFGPHGCIPILNYTGPVFGDKNIVIDTLNLHWGMKLYFWPLIRPLSQRVAFVTPSLSEIKKINHVLNNPRQYDRTVLFRRQIGAGIESRRFAHPKYGEVFTKISLREINTGDVLWRN